MKAEKLYYTALIAYIWYEAPEDEQNFAMLIDLIDASEAREDDENFKNAVDFVIDDCHMDDHSSLAPSGLKALSSQSVYLSIYFMIWR